MFSNIAKPEGEAPSEYELFRLRKNEFVERVNKFILETFDTVTNLAFVLVLLNQGGAVELVESWYIISFRTCGSLQRVTEPELMRLLLNLGIAAAVFFAVKVILRAAAVSIQIISQRKLIRSGFRAKLLLLAGFLLTLFDPWNGTVMVDHQFKEDAENVDELVQYREAVRELRSDWLLLWLQTIPQFVIQVVYASVAADNANLGLPPAWYVSTLTTSLLLVSQLHEVIYLQISMPRIKGWAMSMQHVVTPIVRRVSVANNKAVHYIQAHQPHLHIATVHNSSAPQ